MDFVDSKDFYLIFMFVLFWFFSSFVGAWNVFRNKIEKPNPNAVYALDTELKGAKGLLKVLYVVASALLISWTMLKGLIVLLAIFCFGMAHAQQGYVLIVWLTYFVSFLIIFSYNCIKEFQIIKNYNFESENFFEQLYKIKKPIIIKTLSVIESYINFGLATFVLAVFCSKWI